MLYKITIFFLIELVCLITICSGQSLTNKGQIISISTGTFISVNGSLLNEGTLTNNGSMAISGNWENKNIYNAGTGAIIFNGEDEQIIQHENQEFYSLVIDGKGEKIMNGNVSITGELILKDGLLTPDAVLLVKDNAFVSDGSFNTYINGKLFNEGTGNKFFPIGKNGNYKPVEVEVTGVDPVIGFELFEPNPQPHFEFSIGQVSEARYWRKTMLSGSVDESSTITLPLGDDQLNGTMEQLTIAGADSVSHNFMVLGDVSTSGFMNDGSITGTLATGSDYFAVAVLAQSPEERSLYVPNAFAPFSPKANSEDRAIKVYGKNISSQNFLFRIFDRWGGVVYETTSYDEASRNGWEGTDKNSGKVLSFGVYQYILKGEFNSGLPIERTGSITLLR